MTRATSNGVIACTVDRNPAFHLEALRWFATLTRIAGVAPSDLYVVVIDGERSDLLDHLAARGVNLLTAPAFDLRWAYCNKISGAKALAEADIDGLVVLTDADTAFVADPRQLQISRGAIGGRIVDGANPPLPRVQAVYQQAGLELPPLRPASRDRQPTIACNLNGGFLLIQHEDLGPLARSWERWAHWLLNSGVLGVPPYFAGQMSTALALTELKMQVAEVGPEWNVATHMPDWNTPEMPAPAMVHYHRHLLPSGLLAGVGVPRADQVIERMNQAIAEEFAEFFPDGRAPQAQPTGSDSHSDGVPVAEKRALLLAVLQRIQPQSVLDVGCGDGDTTRDLPLGEYTGIDLSETALAQARSKRPGGRFVQANVTDWHERADLTVCLDVVTHQADAADYRAVVESALRSATRLLLISGYERPPASGGADRHFHEPLSQTVRRLDGGSECVPLAESHGIATFAVVRPGAA